MDLRRDAEIITMGAIRQVLPDRAVIKALKNKQFPSGRLFLVAVGKAAWQMAAAAVPIVGDRLERGIVITKYGHVKGTLPGIECYEAGHPIPDENGFRATGKVLEMTKDLKEEDMVLFLLSGGGSALFEKPLLPSEELIDLTNQFLDCGASIVETNIMRKRVSGVKGGKFAKHCAPARIFSIVLSDILGDPLDMIASGPACADSSTKEDAENIVRKYGIHVSEELHRLMEVETPKVLDNVEVVVSGSVSELCQAAARECRTLGYETHILTDQLDCEAREAGAFLASVARTYAHANKNLAIIAGGETIVHVMGDGKGGRNQEMALAAAEGIQGMDHVAFFSVGSDGTDGPTDAAGGYVDGSTKELLEKKGMTIYNMLEKNDAYRALKSCGGLVVTGPTGTNVNDLSVLLIKGKK